MSQGAERVPTEPEVPIFTPSQLESTIAELEGLGYTHVRISCHNCGHNRLASFFLLRTRGMITETTTFSALADALRCSKCRRALSPDLVRPVHQAEMAGERAGRKMRRDSL
jgi:hypothetical protein